MAIMARQIVNNQWLRQLRHEANWTQEQLAVRIGVASSTLRSWEQGKVKVAMTLEQWEELAIAVNVSLSDLHSRIRKLHQKTAE
ncbi:helix-turn-helix transcriptional regulator [Leptolyngbya boryana]|jgi:transcriptional regulator with XRE-family HTH domain|uniref:helix-turn-helix transcriptional regulator n=2 Tax=Leptolyngbya group TaxID=3081713 RepID=UPI0006885B9E|nr:helix-turn-helix transcriptional regulator [Leptolyngbya boryana]